MEPDLSLTAAAARLGVHYMTAYRYVRTGRLEAWKDGGEWKISRPALDSFMARQTSDPVVATEPRVVRSKARVHLEHRLVAGDEPGAWSVIEDALASGASPDEMAVDVLMPALASIGDRWADGSLSVAEEHRASAVAIRLIGRMGPRFAHRGRKRGTVVVGAPSGERHEMPVALVANLLRRAGFEVVELGPDTPPTSFAEMARSLSSSGKLVAVLVGVTLPCCLGEAG